MNRLAEAALDEEIAGAAITVTPLLSLEPPASDHDEEEQRKEESDDMEKQSNEEQSKRCHPLLLFLEVLVSDQQD